MIIIISGRTHVGKTNLAQKFLEKYYYPYLSIDHLKMGLIRSGNTKLTPLSNDNELTNYLWPIVREMIKTAIENNQNLIVEGCYVPYDCLSDFSSEYINDIKYIRIVFSENYIKNHFNDIIKYQCVIENRLYDIVNIDNLINENKEELELCNKYKINYIFIDNEYNINIDEIFKNV